ncbi:MAG: serine hydrolase, partial [Emcibacteraceae bacterium]|nr:serine hydrolase [Emcibacteraceae bacterium]
MNDPVLIDHINENITVGNYNSIIIATIDEDATNIYVFGEMIKGSNNKPNIDTFFEMSSISKTFLGSLVGILVERGQIKLSDPINKYLPKDVKISSVDDNEITILNLITHFSGLPYMPEDYENDDLSQYSVEDLWKSVNNFKPSRQAGQKWEYSTFGAGLLAQALAYHFDTDYQTMIQDEILTPLNMTETYLTLPQNKKHLFAQGHLPGNIPTSALVNHGALYAGGSMITTTRDMIKYIKAHMGITKTKISAGLLLTHTLYTTNDNMGLAWENTPGSNNRNHYGTGGGHRAYVGFNK